MWLGRGAPEVDLFHQVFRSMEVEPIVVSDADVEAHDFGLRNADFGLVNCYARTGYKDFCIQPRGQFTKQGRGPKTFQFVDGGAGLCPDGSLVFDVGLRLGW